MPALASRFSPYQDVEHDTSSRPVAPVGGAGAEQKAGDELEVEFEFLLGRLPRPRRAEAEPIADQVASDSLTAADLADERAAVVRVHRWPRPSPPKDRFMVLQKWEGTVLSVEGDAFTASLRDLSDRRKPEEEVTVPIDEVEDSDRELLVPGGVFYWSLGYRVNLASNRERVASLRFRRLPAWTEAELDEVRRKAERLERRFSAPGGTPSREDIARRSDEIYQSRGGDPGDWLIADSEMR